MKWFKDLLEHMRNFEPAMLKGVWVALLGLASAFGVVVSPAIDDKVTAYIGVAIAIIALLQGLWTRGAVYPPAVVEAMAAIGGITALTASQVKEMASTTAQDDAEPPLDDAP